MKTLNVQSIFFVLLCGVSLMASCKKENDLLTSSDLVGVWQVMGGSVSVTNNDDINDSYAFGTEGTLTLYQDGKGEDDFKIIIDGTEEALEESYDWELVGTTLRISTMTDVFEWAVYEEKGGLRLTQEGGVDGRPDLTTRLSLTLRK